MVSLLILSATIIYLSVRCQESDSYILAHNGNRERTTLKVEIKVNGKVEASASSNDEFGIATASTSIPR